MNRRDGAARLHASTKHGTTPANPERLVAYPRLDPRNAPRPFKEYRGLDRVPLPRQLVDSFLSATAVLSGEKGRSRPFDSALLGTLLFLSAGVTRMAGSPTRRAYFRSAMSAGNLHPVELYVVAGEVDGIPAGVYHFSPLEATLTVLRSGDYRSLIGADTEAAIVLTGIAWRTTWKYGERGWRHLYWDCGTILANMLEVSDAHGLDHRVLAGFDDAEVGRLLGLDGVHEMPLAVMVLGGPARANPPPAPPVERLAADAAPVAPSPIRLPLLEEAQADGNLAAEEVEAWRAAGLPVAMSAPSDVTMPEDTTDPIEQVVLRRGSTREMLHRPVPRHHLSWPLAAATRAVGIDVIPDGTLLRHYVNVHDVEGVDSGAYRLGGTGLELMRSVSDLRRQSAWLCLGQPLGGDSAYTVFHCADLGPILDALGSRGYRVAQLEAGIVSGRLALCAFALGLGATGLTFFDDPVSRFFEPSAQPMLVTAVGVPATGPAPAGSPGRPAPLRT